MWAVINHNKGMTWTFRTRALARLWAQKKGGNVYRYNKNTRQWEPVK